MPKIKPLLNDIVHVLNEVYEFAPNFWTWGIALTIIYFMGQNEIFKP